MIYLLHILIYLVLVSYMDLKFRRVDHRFNNLYLGFFILGNIAFSKTVLDFFFGLLFYLSAYFTFLLVYKLRLVGGADVRVWANLSLALFPTGLLSYFYLSYLLVNTPYCLIWKYYLKKKHREILGVPLLPAFLISFVLALLFQNFIKL